MQISPPISACFPKKVLDILHEIAYYVYRMLTQRGNKEMKETTNKLFNPGNAFSISNEQEAWAKKTLIDLGWATIGGRAEDYATILDRDGIEAAREAIKETYKEETEDVLRGIIVLTRFGPDAYYNEAILNG